MSTIQSFIENFDYPSALNLINSDIKKSGPNSKLVKAKVFCLINMQKFTLALSTIKMGGVELYLEKAYCLYRLGKFTSSLNLIEKVNNDDEQLKLLKAQVLYRLERFDEAAEIFERIQNNDSEELKVNLLAAKGQAGQNYEMITNPDSSFDLKYNLALTKFFSKDFKASEILAADCQSSESTSIADLVNSKLLSICSLMANKENYPEADFLLRKLRTSELTPLQDLLISSNLFITGNVEKKINIEALQKSSLFKSQKLQIIVNAHHSHIPLPKSLLKLIKTVNSVQSSSLNTFYDIESLKKYIKSKRGSSIASSIDKERWLPLRDRSYYKTKAEYLKAKKNVKASKK